MASDNLFAILGMLRAELPEISDEMWEKLKQKLTHNAGGERLYVPLHRKRSHLDVIAEAGETATAEQLSKILGVSVRRVRQLRRLG